MLLDKIFSLRKIDPARVSQPRFSLRRSLSGVTLTETQALSHGPVWAAVKVISETVAMLPWRVFKVGGAFRVLQDQSTLDYILHRKPNSEMSSFNFREYLVASALLWGNGYAEIEKNGLGEVLALWPIHPSRVTPKRDANATLYYAISNASGMDQALDADLMFHLRGPTEDGITGRSIINLARESFGTGIAAEQFQGAFFGNGATPSYVISEAEGAPEMSPEGAANMLKSFEARHQGPAKAGKGAYLEKGFKIEPLGIPQKDAQFIETRKFQVSDVARWFRLPPHKIGDMEGATFSNIEQQSIDFVVDSIQPWAIRIEQEADIKLHDKRDIITKINMNGILRGDSAARSDFYTKLWGIGVYSQNDILIMEDRNPVAGGDKRYVPLNMAPIGSGTEANSGVTPAAIRSILLEAHERLNNKEINAYTRKKDKGPEVLDAWSISFFPTHKKQLAESVSSAAAVAAEYFSSDKTRLESIIETHCERCVQDSISHIADGTYFDKESRAASQTDQLLSAIAGV
jgi:HK97 family phage portal protein